MIFASKCEQGVRVKADPRTPVVWAVAKALPNQAHPRTTRFWPSVPYTLLINHLLMAAGLYLCF